MYLVPNLPIDDGILLGSSDEEENKESVAWESSYLLSSLAHACAALPGHGLAIRSLASEVERNAKG